MRSDVPRAGYAIDNDGRKFAGVDHTEREKMLVVCARVLYEERKRWENKRVPPG